MSECTPSQMDEHMEDQTELTTEELIGQLRNPLKRGVDGCGYWRELHEDEAYKIADRLQDLLDENKKLKKQNQRLDDKRLNMGKKNKTMAERLCIKGKEIKKLKEKA